jgi:tRNA-2-methylthio-N6-dimethylallyladenosine synthase
MAETPNVMPSLHMPLQSGSDRILAAMRRSYRAHKYLGIIDRVRAAMPDAAITTDVIVGFPGETEDDFAQTLDVVAQARFAGAFTFQYSVRPGTPAATMADQVPADVVAERYQRLVSVVEDSAWSEAKNCVGATVEVLIAEGEGRKDVATQRLSGRARDNRLVHVASCDARPGDVVHAVVSHAAPHHLVADEVLDIRRTRGGDAWQAHREAPATAGVALGMPALRISGQPG